MRRTWRTTHFFFASGITDGSSEAKYTRLRSTVSFISSLLKKSATWSMYSSMEWKAASVPTLSVRLTWTLNDIKKCHFKNVTSKKEYWTTYPTTGFLKFIFSLASSTIFWVSGWYLKRYFINWPIHHTWGSPWRRIIRSDKSLGIASGRKGGRGVNMSTIGSSITWVSFVPVTCIIYRIEWLLKFVECVSLPGQLLLSKPDGSVHVSLSGKNTFSHPPRWYRHFFEFNIKVLLVA